MRKDAFKTIIEMEKAEKLREKKNAREKRREAVQNSGFSGMELLEILKNTFIMLCITAIAGGVLGFVYQITKEPIALVDIRTRQNACRKAFPNADSFSESVFDRFELTEEFLESNKGSDITDCIEAYDELGNPIGYVIEVTSHEGYGGDIVFYTGIADDGMVMCISFIEINETAGLGMRASEVLAPQFVGKKSDDFVVVKTKAVADNQIDAITSATITSNAVTNGVNTALAFFKDIVKGGADNE